MSSEVLGRFLLDAARPGLPHTLWLLDLALLLAEEAVEVTTPAIKAPVTAQQPRVSEQMFFSRLLPLAQEGRMETSPAPSPAATMEPGSGICPLQHSWVCAGVGRNC